MRTGADEASAPKYAHIERERRWLVDPCRRPELAGLPVILIEDRYILETRLRLRKMTDASKGVATFKLTKKYEAIDPLARPIVTAYLDECEYSLFARLPANQIIKQRYKISSLGHEFSLDVFEGALCGLELLEIESPSNKMLLAIQAPDWILREVSHETGFQGGNLANNTE